ncbi:UNVERIFIED_CONTAM: hypothetical protein Slati_0962900 [Sesamum latifolium]|uniref:Uncharacterized protein n=1 Tax=Sesamum latifolium TaxID=2727402 RepID=A0AAW2XQ01_9LAMI
MSSKLIREAMPKSRAAATLSNTRSSQGTPSSSDQRGKRPAAGHPPKDQGLVPSTPLLLVLHATPPLHPLLLLPD